MADSVGMANIRGLDINKTVKGFAEMEYIFKSDLAQATTTGDSLRWYQETNGTESAVSPMRSSNVAFQSRPGTTEKTWTRNTSYVRKYFQETFVPLMDIRTADINVISRSLRALTRMITRDIDAHIWDVLTQSRVHPTGATTDINLITSSGAWNDGASSPVRDVTAAQRVIWVSGGYNAKDASLYISPLGYEYLFNWVFSKGSQIQSFVSERLDSGTITKFCGLNVKVSPNVTADYAAVAIPQVAATYYTETDITSAMSENPGIGSTIRVWAVGEPVLTDPKAVCLVSNVE